MGNCCSRRPLRREEKTDAVLIPLPPSPLGMTSHHYQKRNEDGTITWEDRTPITPADQIIAETALTQQKIQRRAAALDKLAACD